MRPDSFSRENFTGRMIEADFLGEIRISDPRYEERAKGLGATENGYLPFDRAMRLAKDFQPWADPADPEKDLLRDLRLEVFDLLLKKGLVRAGEEDRIKIYTSVGTALDKYHGIDSWLELEDKKGNVIARVTLDITENEKKMKTGGGKADVVFGGVPDPEQNNEKYLELIEALAKRTAETIDVRLAPEKQPETRRSYGGLTY